MFDKFYSSIDSKIIPSDELIRKTKAKMYKELNSSSAMNKKHFYRYGAIAACIVIVVGISLMSPTFESTNSMSSCAPVQSLQNNMFAGSSTDIPAKTGTAESTDFLTVAAPATSSASHAAAFNPVVSFFESIFSIIKNIVQWFKELLF